MDSLWFSTPSHAGEQRGDARQTAPQSSLGPRVVNRRRPRIRQFPFSGSLATNRMPPIQERSSPLAGESFRILAEVLRRLATAHVPRQGSNNLAGKQRGSGTELEARRSWPANLKYSLASSEDSPASDARADRAGFCQATEKRAGVFVSSRIPRSIFLGPPP